jgi:ABC-2 type transport system permease protein
VLSLPATVVSLGLMGLVLASTFVLYRNANALSNLLEYPVWVASGLVFSTSLLPGWTRPISWSLPPYWGILAIRHAALGGAVWGPLGMLLLLGALSLAISAVTFRWFEHAARARATLSLRGGAGCRSSSSAARSPTAASSTGSARRCTCRRCSAARSSS